MEYRVHIRDSIFDCPMALALTSPLADGLRTMCINSKFEELTGYDLEEVVGRDFRYLIGPNQAPTGPAGRAEGAAALAEGVAVKRLKAQIGNCDCAAAVIPDRHKSGEHMVNLVILRPFETGDQSSLFIAAKIPWRITGDLDPNHLELTQTGRVRHSRGAYVPASAGAELRLRYSVFNSYYRVIKAYVTDPRPGASRTRVAEH